MEIFFETLYQGDKKEIIGTLMNNGPKEVSFQIKFIQNLRLDEEVPDSQALGISPMEQGKEQTKRVLTCEPMTGNIKQYSQIPIKFVCKTPVEPDLIGFSDHIKKTKPKTDAGEKMQLEAEGLQKEGPKKKLHETTAIITFTNPKKDDKFKSKRDLEAESLETALKIEPLRVKMSANAIPPEIKISREVLQFGECPTNESREYILKVKNKNPDLELDFNFTKVAHFQIRPNKGKLMVDTPHNMFVSFKPNNFGVFEQTCFLEILGGAYKFPIKLMGSSSVMGKRPAILHGPNAHKDDFKPQPNPM